jgi:hypothetical protein
MRRWAASVVVALIGCGARPTTAPVPSPAASRPPAIPVRPAAPEVYCVERTNAIAFVGASDAAVVFCIDSASPTGPRQCHALDLASHRFAAVDPVVEDFAPPSAQTLNKLQACAPDGGACNAIPANLLSDHASLVANASATRLLAIPSGDGETELWDLDVRQRIARIALAKDSCDRRGVFLEDTVYLSERPGCASHGTSVGTLYDPRGRRLGRVGSPDFDSKDLFAIPLTVTGWWTFFTSSELAIHDITTGALIRRIDVPDGSGWNQLTGRHPRIVLVASGEHTGDVTIIDVATGHREKFEPPHCASASAAK